MQNSDILIILGGAECMLEDLENVDFEDLTWADYMAINSAGIEYLRPIEHWVSYHPNLFAGYEEQRREKGGNLDYITHSHIGHMHEGRQMVTHIWPLPKYNPGYTDFRSGSSTLLGVEVGLALGYRRIIVCGAPLLEDKYKVYQEGWRRALPVLAGRVRSMSGWTKELLDIKTK